MICIIDFDRTFMLNDFFLEAFFRKLLGQPFYIARYFLTSKKNILELKRSLLDGYQNKYDLDLLINPSVKEWIQNNRSEYEKMILVSASPDFFVKKLLAEYSFFDAIHGSSDINLKGKAKLDFIIQHYGNQFDYMGDSRADEPIFAAATRAYKVTGKNITELA